MGCLDGALEHQKEGKKKNKKKTDFFSGSLLCCPVFGVVLKLILGLVWDGFCGMFMVNLWSQLWQVCLQLKGLFLR